MVWFLQLAEFAFKPSETYAYEARSFPVKLGDTGGQALKWEVKIVDVDLSSTFPDSESVNRALRLLVETARASAAKHGKRKTS